jgi:hypothetical protein
MVEIVWESLTTTMVMILLISGAINKHSRSISSPHRGMNSEVGQHHYDGLRSSQCQYFPCVQPRLLLSVWFKDGCTHGEGCAFNAVTRMVTGPDCKVDFRVCLHGFESIVGSTVVYTESATCAAAIRVEAAATLAADVMSVLGEKAALMVEMAVQPANMTGWEGRWALPVVRFYIVEIQEYRYTFFFLMLIC